MRTGEPSRTAFGAAAHRAAHQVLESGRIFADPLALRILGKDADAVVREAQSDPNKRRMRIFIAVRTRFTEDALAAAIRGGVRQIVLLGAGLDTLAYRSSFGEEMRIFEVDYPATQKWKRERLAEAGIPLPAALRFAPVDFERATVADGLAAAGFDPAQQTFVSWLGVVPYLPEPAVWSILRFVAGLQGGGHVAFDYANPPDTFPLEARRVHEKRAAHVASLGEPWITYFDTEKLHAELRALGFTAIEDLGPPQIAARYFPDRAGSIPDKGGHILRAGTVSI